MQEQTGRMRHSKNNTLLGFVDDLRELWSKAGMPGNIVRNYPFDENAELPLITYRTIRRLRNEHFKDIKPRYRTTIEHPHEPGNFIEIYGQIFDVYVEFQIFSTSQEEADELMAEFEEFLEMYKGHFKDRGVQEILFYAQDEDESIPLGRMQMAVRKLQYTVRLERLTPKVSNEIQHIEMKVSTLNKNNIQ